jgi:hypothetical protein
MTDLGDERGHAPDRDNLKPLHRRVEDRCKNAGFGAGVREDLQQLLRGDGHAFLQAIKNPLKAGDLGQCSFAKIELDVHSGTGPDLC